MQEQQLKNVQLNAKMMDDHALEVLNVATELDFVNKTARATNERTKKNRVAKQLIILKVCKRRGFVNASHFSCSLFHDSRLETI